MINLLEETKDSIIKSVHTESDIVFIGSEQSGHQCTWDEFMVLADVEYYSGYGSPKVAEDLIVVFSDGEKLRRFEYDGAEGWEYLPAFNRPNVSLPIKNLVCTPEQIGWVTLAECNETPVPSES